jgi:outer membrane murein-binding lipoprotein Lpp
MGLLDKAKAAAEQAAAKAKEGVEDVQTKRDLGQTYGELGKTTFELIESGEISNPKLEELAEKIRALNEKAAAGDEVPVGATTATHDPSQPPAMPT